MAPQQILFTNASVFDGFAPDLIEGANVLVEDNVITQVSTDAIAGFQVRWIALAFAGFCAISAFVFHYQPAEQMEMIMFMKNIGLAGAFLVLASTGAGKFSLDGKQG
jgi:hypothetical protein